MAGQQRGSSKSNQHCCEALGHLLVPGCVPQLRQHSVSGTSYSSMPTVNYTCLLVHPPIFTESGRDRETRP